MDKYEIIRYYRPFKLEEFLEEDTEKKILDLLDEEGISILKNNGYPKETIYYILNYSKYKKEALYNTNFLDVVLSFDPSEFKDTFLDLNDDLYDFILARTINNNINAKDIMSFFNGFDADYRVKKVINWPYPNSWLYYILPCEAKVMNAILKNNLIDLSKVDLFNFFEGCKSYYCQHLIDKKVDNVSIPQNNIDLNVIKSIWDKYDIFLARKIISDASYVVDVSDINDYIKNKEDKIINNSSNYVDPFDRVYTILKQLKPLSSITDQEYNNDLILSVKNIMKDEVTYSCLDKLYRQEGSLAVLAYIKVLSDRALSNYIIDYHFNENYHNVMIDMGELLRFNLRGHIEIPQERIQLYQQILEIDKLSIEAKKELHNRLKKYDMMGLFYDDMAYARKIVAESIKNYSLSRESIKKYRSEELSKKYGVDVYVMGDNLFLGIVKTSRRSNLYPTGHSYSLVGNGCLAVFGDPKESQTFVYDSASMNSEQLIHVFPYDSFTSYKCFELGEPASRHVNVLMMGNELVKDNPYYTELLFLEQGKIETDIDSRIPELKKIALYCTDIIREQDVEEAKKEDVGIMLVDFNNYYVKDASKFANMDVDDYGYFNGYSEKAKFEARR